MRIPRPRLTYSSVVATIAMSISIAGTSYAAMVVTGAIVRDGSLAGVDMRNGSLTGIDVRDSSLTAPDLANASVGAGEIRDGAVRGADLANGSVTGADVAESTLSQVPNAAKLDGKNAVQIVARARGSVPVTGSGSYPLSSNTWVQAADETDEFFGEITYSGPVGACPMMAGWKSTIAVTFKVDDLTVGTTSFEGEGRFTKTFQLTEIVFEPGTPVSRTLTATFDQAPGWNSCGPVTVESLKMNVVGYR